MKADILAINSQVAYGHVGNAAWVFAWQRLGHEVWPLATVEYSNHPGHGDLAGEAVPAPRLAALLGGLERRGALARCGAVASGYLGDAAQGPVVSEAVERVKEAKPEALYLCDPVIGDRHTGAYVPAEVERAIRERLVPAADLLTPNRFELERLSGRAVADESAAVAAARSLLALGPRLVACTSAPARPERRATLAVTAAGAWRVETPALTSALHGAGDLFAALLLAAYLDGGDGAGALSRAVSAVFAVLDLSLERGGDELALIAAQDVLAAPPRLFEATPV